jgi:hypothetical protein
MEELSRTEALTGNPSHSGAIRRRNALPFTVTELIAARVPTPCCRPRDSQRDQTEHAEAASNA